MPFTHLIHRTGGVYSAHFAMFLVLFNNWPCRLQVGLNSASKKNMLGYWGQMTQGTQRRHKLGQKTHTQASNSQLNGSDKSIQIRCACRTDRWNQYMKSINGKSTI